MKYLNDFKDYILFSFGENEIKFSKPKLLEEVLKVTLKRLCLYQYFPPYY